MDNDNDFLVILDDEDALAHSGSGLDTLLPSAAPFQDSSQAICGIRTRPRVMAWEQGHLVMRTPSGASRPHYRSLRARA